MTDTPQRFSQSSLWQHQRTYFEKMGTSVWQKGIIPHYITTNPFIANAYSQVILGFLRDTNIRLDKPLYIIELGAGSGRLAHQVLLKLLKLLSLSPFADLKVKYILTDFAPKTMKEWREIPKFEEWAKKGNLDYALFDFNHPAPLKLEYSGETVDPTQTVNPPIYIANYVFDGIPQDLFWVENGQLEEYRVAVTWPESPEENNWIEAVDLDFSKHPVPEKGLYELPELNTILEAYQESLDTTVISLPTQSILGLDYLCSNPNQNRLFICADKGYERLEDLAYRTLPNLTAHGSFSMSVNFDAIRRFVKLRDGHVLQPPQRHTHIHVTSFIWNPTIQETRLAFYQAIENIGPDEYFIVKSIVQEYYDELSFVQVMAWLHWTSWDPIIFLRMYDRLRGLINQINEEEEAELLVALQKIGENYLDIGKEEDVDYCLGMIYCGLSAYKEAAIHLERSLQNYGSEDDIYYNLGLCHFELGHNTEAKKYLTEALNQDSNHRSAQDLLNQL